MEFVSARPVINGQPIGKCPTTATLCRRGVGKMLFHSKRSVGIFQTRKLKRQRPILRPSWLTHDRLSGRKALLLSTALASTLVCGALLGARPAHAVTPCTQPATPAPINDAAVADDITCNNVDPRTNAAGDAIFLSTTGDGNTIVLDNDPTGTLNASDDGIDVETTGDSASITVDNGAAILAGDVGIEISVAGTDGSSTVGLYNTGAITATNNGIFVFGSAGNDVTIDNEGAIATKGAGTAFGAGYGPDAIFVFVSGADSNISVTNAGALNTSTAAPGGDGISALTTGGANQSIYVSNSGAILTGDGAEGIFAATYNGANGDVLVINSGAISTGEVDLSVDPYSNGGSAGIFTYVAGDGSDSLVINTGAITTVGDIYANGITSIANANADNAYITILNSGDIVTSGDNTAGIRARARTGADNTITQIGNDATITTTGLDADGIDASSGGDSSPIFIGNIGDLTVTGDGIDADTTGVDSPIFILNDAVIIAGDAGIEATSSGAGGGSGVFVANYGAITAFDDGIQVSTQNDNNVFVTNFGDIATIGSDSVYSNNTGPNGIAIFAAGTGITAIVQNYGAINTSGAVGLGGDGITVQTTLGTDQFVGIFNSGAITTGDGAEGIFGATFGAGSDVVILNSGAIRTGASDFAADPYSNSLSDAIFAYGAGDGSTIYVGNIGALTTVGTYARGIDATLNYFASDGGFVVISNGGPISTTGLNADGIRVFSGSRTYNASDDTPVAILNSGAIAAMGAAADGIDAFSSGSNSGIYVANSASIDAGSAGIRVEAIGANSSAIVMNAGAVNGGATGVVASSNAASVIQNVSGGSITADNLFAIDANGAGAASVINDGLVTGFIDLTDQGDMVQNTAGGTWEARLTSEFGAGADVLQNAGVIRSAVDAAAGETVVLNGLENFFNTGLITLADGGDTDRLQTTGNFIAGSGTLAVDTFLGGPGSPGDQFIIGGNVSGGVTSVIVNNTNPGPGAFNQVGIPVVIVGGTTDKDDFKLASGPIDTGFFSYDLFFDAAQNQHELRSFANASAFILPQLVTAAQDIWHSTTDSWFSRTADLRNLVRDGAPAALANGGASPSYLGGSTIAAPSYAGLSVKDDLPPDSRAFPGLWTRGSAERLGRDDSFGLDRDLEIQDFQAGVDFGKRDVFASGDALIFGAVGGAVQADLDYDQLRKYFEFDGGQAGAYATYLTNNLFIDVLFKADFLNIDTAALGFASSFDATTYGFKAETGYKFGDAFYLEPVVTLAAAWADVDGFTVAANTIGFDDGESFRGRIGLKAGAKFSPYAGAVLEPFAIASLWNEFSNSNDASINSGGSLLTFADNLDDTWGEVSVGVSFIDLQSNSGVFLKTDATFGDDVEGYAGQAGVRIGW